MLCDVQKILETVSHISGDGFFDVITQALHKAIKADCTYIAIINKDKSVKTISLVSENKLIDNIEYPLKDSPHINSTQNPVCYLCDNAHSSFPNDPLITATKAQTYLSIALHDSKKNIIGIVVALFSKALADNSEALMLLQIFSGRITAELTHLNYEASLEEIVLSRTAALSTTDEQLKQTQKKLIESEKMASLGRLVAGITHEVNTPLGIAITTHSIITDEHRVLNDKISNEKLSMKDMQHYCEAVENSLTIQGENLIRAKKLIENFKKTAVDQHNVELETINIKDYYTKVISTLTSILKTKKVSIEVTGCEQINMATYPGVHAQILTNFITNSVRHGFDGIENNNIVIKIIQQGEVVEVHYQDNGIGLSDNVQQHVFEPFFTTARKTGGIGLGMSIVHTLITQKLNGHISIDKKSKGACFIYQFTESKAPSTKTQHIDKE